MYIPSVILAPSDRLTHERALYLLEFTGFYSVEHALEHNLYHPDAVLIRHYLIDSATQSRIVDTVEVVLNIMREALRIEAEEDGRRVKPITCWQEIACRASVNAALDEAGTVYKQARLSPMGHHAIARIIIEEHCEDILQARLRLNR